MNVNLPGLCDWLMKYAPRGFVLKRRLEAELWLNWKSLIGYSFNSLNTRSFHDFNFYSFLYDELKRRSWNFILTMKNINWMLGHAQVYNISQHCIMAILVGFWIINGYCPRFLTQSMGLYNRFTTFSQHWSNWVQCHIKLQCTLFSFHCSDYFVQALFMSSTTVFHKVKPKAHNTYKA